MHAYVVSTSFLTQALYIHSGFVARRRLNASTDQYADPRQEVGLTEKKFLSHYWGFRTEPEFNHKQQNVTEIKILKNISI
jgi:hypothetical protein